MKQEIENLSFDEVSSRISYLRNSGNIEEAIEVCKAAADASPSTYFYPKIEGDLYFQEGNYEEASEEYLVFLQKIPPNLKLFGDFAKRYYRLRRVWDEQRVAKYAERIVVMMRQGYFTTITANRASSLVRNDLAKEVAISEMGQKLVSLLGDDANFSKLSLSAKSLEASNPIELVMLLDMYVLNRKRTRRTFRIDVFCVSIYERSQRYESALKVAGEVLDVQLEDVTIRTLFRVCRKLGDYRAAEKVITKSPQIMRPQSFNRLYELVYYYEAKNDLDKAHQTLTRMERTGLDSIPIQKTVRNFYLRFGMLDDVNMVEDRISKLYESGKKTASRFADKVDESTAAIVERMTGLETELEYNKRLAAISDLTTGISHELGQPLTNIRYTVQFYRRELEEKLTKGTIMKVFDSILEETQRMGGLIKRLAPITSSRAVIEKFDVVEWINGRFRAENIRLKEAQIETRVSPDNAIYMVGDPVKFEQIISNLLLNAIDGIKENSDKTKPRKINVRVEDKPKEVNIVFQDTGTGIPAKNRGKIFDPFYSTKAPGKGEGLGLFIVWNLLKMQGGAIILDPKSSFGTRFLISIPKETIKKEV